MIVAALAPALLVPLTGGLRVAGNLRATARQRGGAIRAELPAIDGMKLKEIKAELDERGVTWKGVCFEKEDLQRALETARSQPPPPPAAEEPEAPAEAAAASPPPPPPPAAEPAPPAAAPAPPTADEAAAYDAAYATAYADCMKMRVKELRTQLAARSLRWGGLVEKEELASLLAGAMARGALFSRSGALQPGLATIVDEAAAREEIADDRSPMLLDVFATWCGPCKMIAPMLEKCAAELGEQARFAKIDSDLAPALSNELRVQGLPTLVFYREGKEVHRLEGAPQTADQMLQLCRQYLLG